MKKLFAFSVIILLSVTSFSVYAHVDDVVVVKTADTITLYVKSYAQDTVYPNTEPVIEIYKFPATSVQGLAYYTSQYTDLPSSVLQSILNKNSEVFSVKAFNASEETEGLNIQVADFRKAQKTAYTFIIILFAFCALLTFSITYNIVIKNKKTAH